MSNELMNVDAFKTERPAFDADFPADESLAAGIGISYGIIGIKGKTWSLRYRGETFLFKKADGSLADFIDVVILRSAPTKSKSYFPGGYEDGANKPPMCSSLNGVTPEPDSEQVQAEACAICPRNDWKTMPNGRKGRECQDYQRLAVALLPAQTKAFFGGEPLQEPVFLRVPPASLNGLAMLEREMGPKGRGYHFAQYVTRLSFVELDGQGRPMSYPQIKFFALQQITTAQKPAIVRFRNDPQCSRITGEVAPRAAIAGPTVVNAAAFPPTGSTRADIVKQIQSQPSPAAAFQKRLEPDTETAKMITIQPSTVVETGFESVDVAGPLPPVGQVMTETGGTPIQQPTTTVADTGVPEESDKELDRRIAGLLNKGK